MIAAGDPQLALLRLVGVGVAADVDELGRVARAWTAPPPAARAASGLKNSLVSKSRPGRQAHVGVGGPGVAVDAAVLAAPVGIDRGREADVGAVVAADDHLGLLGADGGRRSAPARRRPASSRRRRPRAPGPRSGRVALERAPRPRICWVKVDTAQILALRMRTKQELLDARPGEARLCRPMLSVIIDARTEAEQAAGAAGPAHRRRGGWAGAPGADRGGGRAAGDRRAVRGHGRRGASDRIEAAAAAARAESLLILPADFRLRDGWIGSLDGHLARGGEPAVVSGWSDGGPVRPPAVRGASRTRPSGGSPRRRPAAAAA